MLHRSVELTNASISETRNVLVFFLAFKLPRTKKQNITVRGNNNSVPSFSSILRVLSVLIRTEI